MDLIREILERSLRNHIITKASQAGVNYARTSSAGIQAEDKEFQISLKGYAKVFFIVGLVFLTLFAIIFSLPNNMDEGNAPIILSFCGGTLALTFGPAFLFSRWHFSIRDNILTCRSMLGRKKQIPVSELSGYLVGEEGKLILFRDQEKFFVISFTDHTDLAVDTLVQHGVPCLNDKGEIFVVKVEKSYAGLLIGLLVFLPCPLIILGLVVHMYFLALLGLVLGLIMGISFYRTCSERISVEGDRFVRTIFLGKPVTVLFSQVDHAHIIEENNNCYLCFYEDGKLLLKVMAQFANYHRLVELATRRGWLDNKRKRRLQSRIR